MKTLPFMNLWRAVAALFLFSGILVQPGRSATCGPTDLASTDPTAYVATPPNLVTVLNATTSAQCTIAVGISPNSGPNNLAVTPDGTKLFVENDTEASLSVVDLGTGAVTNVSLSGVTAPMTANLAVSPDGTIVYLVVLGTGATNPALYTVTTASPYTVTAASGFNTSSSLVAAGGPTLGIAFTPDATTAYVATEGVTYVVTGGATPSISTTVAVTGGSVAVAPNGAFAYVVDVLSNPATVYKIAIPANTVSTISPALTCTAGGAVAITPDSSTAYVTCPGNTSVIKIATGTNSVSSTITYTSTAPGHLAVTSDGKTVYTSDDTGAVTLVSVSGNSVSGSLSVSGSALVGIAFRPVQIVNPPTAQSVATGKTYQFTSTLNYAFNSALTWAVNGTTGGNLATVGSVSVAGLYTAPNAIPTPNPVPVSASSTEIPVGSLLYPSQGASANVTVTPSQIVFTVQPVSGDYVNNPMAEVDVSVEDAAGNVDTSNTDTISISISAPGAFSGASTTSVAAVSGVAKFTNLVPTVAGSSFTLTATDATLSLTSQPSSLFAVAASAPTKLAFTNAPLSLSSNVCSSALTVQAQDAGGIGSNVASTETLALTTSSGGGHFFSDSACGTGITSIAMTANTDSVTFYYKDPKSGSQTLTATGSGAFAAIATQIESVASGPAAYFVITGSATQTAGTSQTLTITAEDSSGNPATTYTGTHTVTFSGAHNSTNPVTAPTVTDNTAVARAFGAGTSLTFTSGVSTAGGSMILYAAEAATIAATDGTIGTGTGGQTLVVTVSPAAAAKFILTGTAAQTAGTSQQVTLTAQDAYGNTATGYTGAHNITFSGAASSSNPVTAPTVTDNTATARAFGTSTALTFTAGVSTVGGSMTLYASGTPTIAATDGTVSTSNANGQSLAVTVSAAAAAKLVITGSTTQTAGTSQTITITAQDAFGNAATSYAGSKSLTFTGANPSPNSTAPIVSGVKFGTADPITFTAGVATPSMTLYKAETATVATTDGAIGTSSANGIPLSVAVSPAAPANLAFTPQPVGGALSGVGGTTFGPQVVIDLSDTFGNPATNSSAAVSLSSTYSSTPANAAAKVGGTTSVAAVAGIATFNNLQFPIAGTYTLTASSSGATNVTSNPFTLTSAITVATPASSVSTPLTIRVGSTTLTTSTTNDPNKPTLDVTWNMACSGTTVSTTVTNGTATSACGTITAGANGSFSATYAAPAIAPSPATVTVSATSIADPTKSSATVTITLVGDSAAVSGVGSAPTSPVVLSSSVPSASSTVDLLGPAATDGVTFAVSCGSVMLNGSATALVSCQPAPSSTSGSANASGISPVQVTLSGSFAAGVPPAPNGPQTPFSPGTRNGLRDWRIPALLLVLSLFGLVLNRAKDLSGYRLRRGLAFVFLLCLSAMWMSACTQFSVPPNPPPPVPPTPAGTGSAVITFTPAGAGPGGDNFQTVKATVYFSVQ